MKPNQRHLIITTAAVGLSIASAVVCLADSILRLELLYAKTLLLVMATVISGVALLLYVRRQLRQQHVARTYLELLCHANGRDLSPLVPSNSLPALDRDSPWHEPLNQIRQRLGAIEAQQSEMDHARASLEIRARRFAAQHKRISSILATLAEPVIAVDRFDELLLANSSAENLFGLDTTKAEHRVLSQLLKCEKLVAMLSDTRRRRAPITRTDELEWESTDGQRHWYSVTTMSLPDENEEPDRDGDSGHGAVAVLRDISAQKVIQRQHAEFVSSVSHEMKAPLAGIKAYIELLVDGDAEDEETREEFLDIINGQADRLNRLVENLLNLARIEAGVVEVSKRSQSLNEILAEAASVIQPAAEAKQIELVQDLSPLYLGAYVDRDMFLQAAINLLSNAVKYTPNDGKVTLRSRLRDQELVVEVEDSGVGLSEEDCQRVFDKFYRVSKDKQMAPGTGLGLPLAKHIVEDVHGGRLYVTSTLGVGSTFTISIPSSGGSN